MGLVAALLWGAGGRRKLWDLDLSKFANHQTEMTAQVWGIRFSPDESKVAFGFGPSWNSDPRPRHLVVVDVRHQQTALHEFELNGYALPSGDSIVWSPSGTILVARTQTPAMFRLDGGTACIFPKESAFGGFLSEDRMVIYIRRFQKPTELQVFSPDCSVSDSWKIDGVANIETSPEQDLLAIQTLSEALDHSVIELVSSTHEVKQRWTLDAGPVFSGNFLFSDRGGLVCSANPSKGKPLPDVACWNTQTGVKSAENDKVGVDLLGIESAGGDLLAITDSRYISLPWKGLWEFFDMGSEAVVPRRRLVWDVRSAKDIARWELLHQKELWGKDLKSARTVKTNFVVSLSAMGKYLAEGGSGTVSLYALQP